jgi:Zn finger protein HypA/HybF involved in hydrogenase expression
MKKLISLSLVILFGLALHAQPTTTESAKPVVKKQVQNPAAYACPKCFHISKGAGLCPDCKQEKVQLGTYYCTKCLKSTGTKPGDCPMCKTATVQMTRKYCAKMGGTPLKNTPTAKPESKG